MMKSSVAFIYFLAIIFPSIKCFQVVTLAPAKSRLQQQKKEKPVLYNDITNSEKSNSNNNNEETRIFFDIEISSTPIGQLVFNLGPPDKYLLPNHTQNIIKLCKGDMRGIDPRCTFERCEFKFSPQFVEGFPQYRWAHICDGKGINAVRAVDGGDRISDLGELMKACSHSIYGGTYYGMKYIPEEAEEDIRRGVLFTVPLVGMHRGKTSFSIVRVSESPQEWRERLLLNSAVLGYLESGIETLHAMQQTNGPPCIVQSGTI